MYTPNYRITNKLLTLVGAIDVAREIITTAPLVPAWERKFQKDARAKIIHHGTHLEGNDLQLNEVESILEPVSPVPHGSELRAIRSETKDSSEPLRSVPQVVGRDRDVQEVINYRAVMDYIDSLVVNLSTPTPDLSTKYYQLNTNMLKEIHRLTTTTLLPDTESGQYRSVKVVIRNTQTKEITFRPPSPIEIPYLVDEFFTWLSTEGKSIHPLLRAGLLHYELVAIHPFTDGNGRTARAMALLLLFLEGYEVKKFFSLEEYYDTHPEDYYKALQSVTQHNGDLTIWLEYFLEGIAIEFTRVKNIVQKLSLDLHLKTTLGGKQITLSERQIKLVEYLERYGEISMVNAREILKDVSDDTILRDLRDLVTKNLISRRGNTKGAKYYLKTST